MTGANLTAVYKHHDRQQHSGTLQQSLQALREQAPDAEVIVIVDDQPDYFDEPLERWPEVTRVIDGPAALTPARNLGAREATREYVAFIDDDAIPTADWWPAIEAALAHGDAAGGPLVPDRLETVPDWLPRSYWWLIGCGPFYGGLDVLVANTYGSNLVVDREAFLAVGGFDESVGAGTATPQGEEADLCRRLRAAGYEAVVYSPAARMRHVIEPADVAPRALLARAYAQGRAKARVGVGGREASFIREELGAARTPAQAVAEATLTGAVGLGWLRGRVVG